MHDAHASEASLQGTFDEFQVVGDFLQDGEAGQNQAEGAAQARPWTALWLVPLASLQDFPHNSKSKHSTNKTNSSSDNKEDSSSGVESVLQ